MYDMKNKKFLWGVALMSLLLIFSVKADADELDAPRLLRLYTQTKEDASGYVTRITFTARPGNTCYIYRKMEGGRYHRIGKTIADDDVTSFTDHDMPTGNDYIYTVRQRGAGIYNNRLSRYDSDGLISIRGTSQVRTRVGNLNTRISWRKNSHADGYRIYRNIDNSRFELIGTASKYRTTFTDVYSRTMDMAQKNQFLLDGCYLDTSSHTVSYTVRATKHTVDFDKLSMSPYQKDGYYHLGAPIIVDLDEETAQRGVLSFTSVPYATMYRIQLTYLDSHGKRKYTTIRNMPPSEEAYIDCEVPIVNNEDYTVEAVTYRNGKRIVAHSSAFTLKYRNYIAHSILYIGDSITYGSPYKTDLNRYVFSYPWRVSELTDADYYNAAIPGATMAFKEASAAPFHRYRIIRDVVPRINTGTTPYASKGLLEPNKRNFYDFDTIVILAGTNDYTDLVPVGSTDSDDDTTYCGALNKLMRDIKRADEKRVRKGRSHISVIMPDLFYSDRCMSFTRRQSRFKTKNHLGYTLKNYNSAKNSIIKKYRDQGMKIYRFKTGGFVNSKNCPYVTADNLHMTKYTYEKIGNALTQYLVKNVW